MNNPNWDRQANVAKVSLDLIEMELQTEFENGNLSRQRERQPTVAGEAVQNNFIDNPEDKRNKNADSGADY